MTKKGKDSLTAGRLIRILRRRLGLTQLQLAARLNRTPTTIVRYETGRARPSWEVLQHLGSLARDRSLHALAQLIFLFREEESNYRERGFRSFPVESFEFWVGPPEKGARRIPLFQLIAWYEAGTSFLRPGETIESFEGGIISVTEDEGWIGDPLEFIRKHSEIDNIAVLAVYFAQMHGSSIPRGFEREIVARFRLAEFQDSLQRQPLELSDREERLVASLLKLMREPRSSVEDRLLNSILCALGESEVTK